MGRFGGLAGWRVGNLLLPGNWFFPIHLLLGTQNVGWARPPLVPQLPLGNAVFGRSSGFGASGRPTGPPLLGGAGLRARQALPAGLNLKIVYNVIRLMGILIKCYSFTYDPFLLTMKFTV